VNISEIDLAFSIANERIDGAVKVGITFD